MMQYCKNNRIFTKYIFSIFVVFAFLAPISVSLTESVTMEESYTRAHISVSAQPSIAHAQQFNDPSAGSTWQQSLGNVVLSTAAFFTYIGGKILEYSVDKLVFGMGDLINNKGLGISIDTTWKVIRDICNLAFIFGFVYVGIRTILDPENANTKRFLSRIIVGALLINFSLFFTKIVIDFSNFTAVQLYQSMVSGQGNISETFMKLLGLSGFYQVPNPQMLANVSGWGGFWFYLMGAVMFLVSAFVMAAGGIMLIVRFVALILIMIFSPILFAATVFPKTEEYASNLWKQLLSYSFFAPVYLLLLLISISILQGVSTSLGLTGKTLAEGFRNQNDAFGVILNFVIVILFLIFSLHVAKKMGVAGGDMAVSVGNNLRSRGQRFIGSSTLGLGARAGRATIGKAAYNLSERDGLKDAASRRGIGGWAARRVLKGSRVVGDASFDARNIPGVGNTLGIGEGRKGGFSTIKTEVEKKEKEFAQSLGEVGDDDVQVLGRKKEADYAKKNFDANKQILQDQIKKITGNTPADNAKRIALQTQIDDLEEAKEDAKINYEKEKQRRIIGSTYAKPTDQVAANTAKADVDAAKAQLDTRWDLYKNLNDAQKEAQRPIIQGFMKDLKEKKKAYEKMLRENDDGYAGVLEGDNLFTSWPTGRLVAHNNEAGKAVRKTAEKGLPKKKDD